MDIRERLKKVRFFAVTPDTSSLCGWERSALRHCVEAAKLMTEIYLRQVSITNTSISRALHKRKDEEGKNLFKYFEVQGSPWDEFDHDTPFVNGVGERPKFGSFYPHDLTKKEWDAWLLAHPKDREVFEKPTTVIDRLHGELRAIPYSEAYSDLLEESSRQLLGAASKLHPGALQNFLRLRAQAFLSNDYWDSDLAWVDTDGHPFEVTIGPYEVYFDKLLGLKASFEAFVALPDKDATEALGRFSPLVPEFDVRLSEEFKFKPKGAAIPLEVVADVWRGGEAAFGRLFIAYNLPNDRRIHELKGSKKVFSRTMMEAKFKTLSYPIAERIFSPEDLDSFSFHNRLLFVLGHELSHGLGPSTVLRDGKEVNFEKLLGDLHSALEEAKANMLGARLLGYFRERGVLDDATLAGCVATEIGAYIQGFRTGYAEAHAKGNLTQYNWIKAHDGVRYDSGRGVLVIDYEKAFNAMSLLAAEFLKLQAAGDYDRAKAFMDEWGSVPPEIPELVKRVADLPLAVHPIYHEV